MDMRRKKSQPPGQDKDVYAESQQSMSARHTVQILDWHESSFYQKHILAKQDIMNLQSAELVGDDDLDYIERAIKQFRMRRGNGSDELLQHCANLTQKCYRTIEYIYAEIMGPEGCAVELEAQARNNPYIAMDVPDRFPQVAGKNVLTLENLMKRLQSLMVLRREIV